MKRLFTVLAVVLLLAVIGFTLASNKKTLDDSKKPVDRSQVAISVTLQPVRMLDISGEVSLPATLAVEDEASISAETAGRIETLTIQLGSNVKKAQVVGHIDVKELQLKLAAAELAIEKLTRDYERNKVLAAGNAINSNAVNDSKFDLENKKLEAEQLRRQIAKADITSPVDGIVTDRKMVAGEFVGTGTVVATVVDAFTLKAKVYVPENKIFSIKMGQRVTLTADAFPQEAFSGVVSFINPQGDANHNYLVELAVRNTGKLKAGLYMHAKLDGNEHGRALQIPKIALAEGIKNPYVYVAENGVAVERRITLGREAGENIEVLSGLREGEQVIVSGLINIIQGSKIKSIQP